MPPLTSENQRERRLRQLLRLKCHEKPGEDFWETFEGDFQRELVRRTVAPRKAISWPGFLPRWVLPTVALMMVLSFVWFGSGERRPVSEASGDRLSSQADFIGGTPPLWQGAPVYEIVSTQYVTDTLRFQPSGQAAPVENRLSQSNYVSDSSALEDGLRSGTAVIR